MVKIYEFIVEKPVVVREYDFWEEAYLDVKKMTRIVQILATSREQADDKMKKYYPDSHFFFTSEVSQEK